MAKRKIKAVLIDLSGTLHIGDKPIPHSIEALNTLVGTGCFVRFVTNTSKESRAILHSRLTRIGYKIEREHIHNALTSAAKILENRKLSPLMLVAKEALEDLGIASKSAPTKYDCVVIGLAPEELCYEKINEAFRLLMDGAPLIALNSGKYYAREDGLAIGAGCFVKGLEYAAQTKAELIGKPNESFFKSALHGQGINLEETVMIGDDVTDDIGGALAIGMNAILVQTGKYRQGDEDKIKPLQPTATVDSFAAAVEYIKTNFEVVPHTFVK